MVVSGENWSISVCDALTGLSRLPAEVVQCCVTSPPYWGLRDYGVSGQLGQEESPEGYIENMVAIFRAVSRVMRDDGVLWLNLGDTYAKRNLGCTKKGELCGIPYRTARALSAAGWYLRQAPIWHKPSPIPSSVKNRCTSSHEFVFMLTKRPAYYYDADALREPTSDGSGNTRNRRDVWRIASQPYKGAHFATMPPRLAELCILAGTSEAGACSICGAPYARQTERRQITRERPNEFTKRTGEAGTGNYCANTIAGVDVATLGWQPSCGHQGGYAVPCCVLDPFAGSGTTLAVAVALGRSAMGFELNPEYAQLAKARIDGATPKSLRLATKPCK